MSHVLWGRKYGVPIIRITGGTLSHCREEMHFRTREGGWEDLGIYPEGMSPSRKEWQLPYRPRMINDRDPGHYGAVCIKCAARWLDRLQRAAESPMLTSPYGGGQYRSPHYGTYLHESRVIQWACAIGHHKPIQFGY